MTMTEITETIPAKQDGNASVYLLRCTYTHSNVQRPHLYDIQLFRSFCIMIIAIFAFLERIVNIKTLHVCHLHW